MKRTPIRAVSKKRQAVNRQRRVLMDHLRETQDWCSICGETGRELNGHELLGRAQGGSVLDLDNIILACNPCNVWVEDNPREAAEQGFKISKKWAKA